MPPAWETRTDWRMAGCRESTRPTASSPCAPHTRAAMPAPRCRQSRPDALQGPDNPICAPRSFFVGGTAVLVVVLGPFSVDCRSPVSRANDDPPKALLKWLQQLFAKPSPGFNGAIRIIRNVGDALDLADFRVEEIAHEKCLIAGRAPALLGPVPMMAYSS